MKNALFSLAIVTTFTCNKESHDNINPLFSHFFSRESDLKFLRIHLI